MYGQLKLENQLCFRLYAASRLVTQAYHPFLEELGITYPQYLVLLVLWEQDAQPVNDLARRLHLETNTVTPLLQRMEKEGLVTRKRGKEDAAAIPAAVGARAACSRLTPASVPELFATLDELIATLE